MMERLQQRARTIAARRVEQLVTALGDAADAELPLGLFAERRGDGVAIGGRGLVRRLAFDARLRGLIMLVRAVGR